ncbi:amidohydrolase [Phenylobacterium montanum]|uniref:Amidohydrolase n=1 Tax=Phenylobacterium montanum TaxID=2823693 RepID=A0A975G378_9CAUL|nr:amidohydrolase [Caulobacter sp. S6]QUD89738.1 amidohydrolase [Caulobacter sp. S6]
MTASTTSRRAFLGGAAALLPALARAQNLDPRSADSVVLNARVLTVDKGLPKAEAFAVRGGRFIAVGRSEDIKGLVGPGTQVLDAKGMAVVPGFIDCHNHAPGEELLYEVLVGNPYEVEFVTIDSIIGKLRERAAKTPPGFWVEGFFHDDTKLKSDRPLNRHDLDQVSSQHPVMVHHRGGHTVFVNSKALDLAGITKATPNPFGGTYDHGPDGELNGRVTDLADRVFYRVGQRPSFTAAETAERARAGLAHISRQFVRYGLTSVHHEAGDLSALQEIRARGDLLHRVSYEADDAGVDRLIAEGVRSGFGDEWLRFGATFEHLVDGSFSERTMALSTPYPGSNPPYRGNVTQTQEDLNAWIEKVWRAGVQVNCHANGDVAIGMYLTACERAQQLFPRADARPKITHCTLVNDDLIRRIKAAGAVPAVFSTYPYYNSDKFKFYGEAMLEHCIAIRQMLDAGVVVAAGSDFPPGPFSPLMALQAMVTRTGWDGKTWGANQRVSVEEALRVHTLNGAYNSGEEAIKGSITPGKLADYVVLADSPAEVDPAKIKDIEIVRTVTGGVARYQA